MIPKWDISGVLPPILPGEPGHSSNRSPYKVELSEVVEKFSTSPERRKIIQGLLEYRHELYLIGITSGFQWLDGSFLENIEVQESRPPNDIDVVSFFHLPDGFNQQLLKSKHGELFTPEQTKLRFHVDAYPYILGQDTSAYHVRMISYWYSMWSHRRDGVWKGFIQVDLSESKDVEAEKLIKLILEEKGVL